ncbi:MAG TPA: DUF4157 domain-containing protein [Pyrinomonadaceae bacterium]|nr:DUF4157 domain-containing protein [Pyrinomonadaceae bacterium]
MAEQHFNARGLLIRLRLNHQAHHQIERFLREHFDAPHLRLPPIKIYTGRVVDALARLFQFSAITFGQRIFVSRQSLRRDGEGRLTMPGWLLAHEAVHVCQYGKKGHLIFLAGYSKEYVRSLLRDRKFDSAARMAAYLSISAEVAARHAEEAYRRWTAAKQ